MLPRRLSFARWFLCMSTAFPSASRMSCCMMAKAARSVVGHHECGRDETIRHRIGFTPVGPRRFPSGSFGRCEIPALALRGRRPGVRVRVRASVGARGCSVRARGWREERAEGSARGRLYISMCRGPGSATSVFVPGLRHMWRHSGTAPSWPLCRPTTEGRSQASGGRGKDPADVKTTISNC